MREGEYGAKLAGPGALGRPQDLPVEVNSISVQLVEMSSNIDRLRGMMHKARELRHALAAVASEVSGAAEADSLRGTGTINGAGEKEPAQNPPLVHRFTKYNSVFAEVMSELDDELGASERQIGRLRGSL